MVFKDHFSRDSKSYAEFRPKYPAALFAWLASVSPGTKLAWDAGRATGQAAIALAQHFERVMASDPSEKQIREATTDPRVTYEVAAEEIGLDGRYQRTS
jgi:predicted O-methyltransferase YrrM